MNMYSYKGVNWCYPIQGVMLFPEDIGCQIKRPEPGTGYFP